MINMDKVFADKPYSIMNSSSIRNVSKVVLLYPRVSRTDQMVGEYEFLDSAGSRRPLEIRTIDLLGCLSWGQFLKSFKDTYSP